MGDSDPATDQFNGSDAAVPPESHLTLLEFFVQPRPEPFEIALTDVAFTTRVETQANPSRSGAAPGQAAPNL